MSDKSQKAQQFAGLVPRDDFADKEPRIRDLDLGERLGYENPITIRKLVRKLQDAGHLPGVLGVSKLEKPKNTGNLPPVKATEFWLDEPAALLVASQSGMAKGIEVTKEVIRVFVLYRRGELPTAPDPIHPLFARQRAHWQMVWYPRAVQAISALYGHSALYTLGGPMPGGWFAAVIRKIYCHVWDSEHVAEAIRRSPNPRHGDNWHQHLTPEARAAFMVELERIVDLAELCLDHADPPGRFWERMGERYLDMPMQLGFRGMLTLVKKSS